jgi:fatty acid desaturase
MDIEIILLNIIVYAVVLIYAFGHLNWPVFYLLFHLTYMRVFMGNHSRMHSAKSNGWPKLIEAFAEYFAVVVAPWDEPYDSIKKKHITHHMTHLPSKMPENNMNRDPHSAFETGGFWRSLLSSMFYEGVQLVHDIRQRKIAKSRWIRLAVYLPLQILFVITFGWEKYLGLFLAMRLMSSMAWFAFSWVLHQPALYKFGAVQQIPKVFQFLFGVINGKRVMDGFFRHASHHAFPHVPSGRLHEVDTAVLRNPDAMPEMLITNA